MTAAIPAAPSGSTAGTADQRLPPATLSMTVIRLAPGDTIESIRPYTYSAAAAPIQTIHAVA